MRNFRNYLLVSLFAVLGACGGDSDNAVECAETCSADATCNTSGDVGGCECNAGFTGDGLTCEADDACTGVSDCTTEGVTCSADELVTCEADANGCLVETAVDCTATDEVCFDDGTTATCAAECSDAVACDGLADGDSFCDGNTPTTCDEGATGCLEANAATSCMLDVCDTSGGSATCIANASGDSCAEAFLVLDDVNLVGTDITADFTDVEAFTGEGCSATTSTAGVDAVFSVPLLAGQTVSISEHGEVDIVLGITPTCEGAAACYAGVDGFSGPVEEAGISYTATEDETVSLYASAFFATPAKDEIDYDIRIAITTCGDGVTEGAETCDDANAVEDDGCNACNVTFGFECDNSAASVCTGPTDLGSYAVAEAIPDTVEAGALLDGEVKFYTITFTDSLLITGALTLTDGEDADIFFVDENVQIVFSAEAVGSDAWTAEGLAAGTYTIAVVARGDVPSGWTLTMETSDSCGDGIVQGVDECDDGNAIDDDRCSDTCVLNADVDDLDGNDDFMNAQALGAGEVARGGIDPDLDPFDLYTFTLAEESWVTVEQYNTVDADTANYDGPGLDDTIDCNSDLDVRIFPETGDPTDNGTAIVFDDLDGDGLCGFAGATTDGLDVLLAPGTYYIKVSEFGDNAAVPLYGLDLQIDTPIADGDACDTSFDLCDLSAGLVCNPTTDTCTLPPEDRGLFELFGPAEFDLAGTSITFTPAGDVFTPVTSAAAAFPDTAGAGVVATTELNLGDDDSDSVTTTTVFPFFGVDRTEFFVGSNGFVSFDAGRSDASESISEHFSREQVALFWDDLAPNVGGTITVDEFADRVTVTFDAVRAFSSTNTVSAQAQFFDTGVVTLTYLTVEETDALVGISAGDGIGNPPAETNFLDI